MTLNLNFSSNYMGIVSFPVSHEVTMAAATVDDWVSAVVDSDIDGYFDKEISTSSFRLTK